MTVHDETKVQKLKICRAFLKTKEEKLCQVFLTICLQPLPKHVRVAAFYEHISSPVFLSNITDLLRGKCLTTPGSLSVSSLFFNSKNLSFVVVGFFFFYTECEKKIQEKSQVKL